MNKQILIQIAMFGGVIVAIILLAWNLLAMVPCIKINNYIEQNGGTEVCDICKQMWEGGLLR